VEKLRAGLPELPVEKKERFLKEYRLEGEFAEVLIKNKQLAGYFEAVVSELKRQDKDTPEKPSKDPVKTAAAFLAGDFLRLLGKASTTANDTRITAENFAELVLYFAEDKISNLAAKKVLEEMFRSGEDPSDIIDRLGLWQMSDAADLESIARHILEENPKATEDFKNGKAASLQFLVGQVMKETRGKANPKIIQEIIKKLL